MCRLHCGFETVEVIPRLTDPTCHYVSYCDPLISHYSHCHPVIHGGLMNVIHLTWERMSGWYFGVAESSWASSCQGVVAPVFQINLFLFQTICSPKCEHLYQNKCVSILEKKPQPESLDSSPLPAPLYFTHLKLVFRDFQLDTSIYVWIGNWYWKTSFCTNKAHL